MNFARGKDAPSLTLQDPIEAVAALGTHVGRSNPYPLYASLREHGPVLNFGPKAVVLGYDECADALRNPAFISTDGNMRDKLVPGWREQPAFQSICTTMLFKNDPDHERLRRFASSPFTPRRIGALRDAINTMAEEFTNAVEEASRNGGTVEFMEMFACRLPVAVMCHVLGVPKADRGIIQPWMRPITEALDPFAEPAKLEGANKAVNELAVYFGELVKDRRNNPADDLISQFVAMHDSEADLSHDELIATFMVLLVAGTAAPFDMLGNIAALAANYPDHTNMVRKDPGFADQFVEESFRFDPAVQVLNRIVGHEINFYGTILAPDTAVLLLIAAANRDPRRYTDPGLFDPHRVDIQPLSFGMGAHYCLGHPLARMMARSTLSSLARRFTTIEVVDEPNYRNQLIQRGYETLRIAFAR